MIYLLLDIFFYNYTKYKTCLFLLNVNNKSIFTNIIISLYIDLFITHTYILVTLYVLGISILLKVIKINYYNVGYYYLINIILMYIFYHLYLYYYNYLYL